MSISLLIAITCYLLGIITQWLELRQKIQEIEEYSNFPIVWAGNLIIIAGYFIQALMWPYSLILNDER
jgi:uncharacterized membrane protein